MKYFLLFLFLTLSLSSKSVETKWIPIFFEGNQIISTSELEEVVGAKKPPVYAFWKDEPAKINSVLVPKLKETFLLFYKNEGFYDANISTEVHEESVTVHIEENQPIYIAKILIQSDLDLSDDINLLEGVRFRAKEFKEMKHNIHKRLLSEGYCSPELSTKAYIDLERHFAYIKIKLEKRELCHFGKVTIETESPTMDNDVILSRLQFEEGDVFDIGKIKESYEALYGLEAFDQLNLDYSRNLYNKKPVKIRYKEISKQIHTRVGVGYATDLKFQGKFYWEYRNFKGNGKKLVFDTLLSQKQQVLENRFFVPYALDFYDYHLDFYNSLGYSVEKNIHNFDEQVIYDKIYFTHAGSTWYNSFGLGVEQRNIYNSPDFDENFFLIYPFIKLVYDKRDSKLDPKNGFYFSHEMEYGLPYSPDSTTYLKYQEELRLIYTVEDVTLSSVGRMGAIKVYNNNMPESKKFFGGGAFSNRAYGYDRLGITTSTTEYNEHGGFTFANLSLEANFPLFSHFGGAVFMDNTMITQNQGIWEFSDNVISSVGVGFRYLTPMGPFKIDMGMNIHKYSDNAIHFQVGQSF